MVGMLKRLAFAFVVAAIATAATAAVVFADTQGPGVLP